MEQEKKSSFRTLLLSVLFSASGPIVLGLGLMVGHSSTQIADFTRRTAELLALIVALIVYAVTNRRQDMEDVQKKEWEKKRESAEATEAALTKKLALLMFPVKAWAVRFTSI